MIRRPTWRVTGIFVGAILGLAFLAGCGVQDDSASDERGGTLTIGIAAPDSLNPTKANNTPGVSQVLCLTYDSLIVEESDGTFSPGLATDWGYVDDESKVFELTIREGAAFSDGDPLDAEAVAGSLNAAAEAGVTAQLSGIRAEATDEYTVRLTSDTPQPDYELILTPYYTGACIVSPTGLADPGALETESHGVGPYIIDSVNAGVEIVLRANEDYYDQSRVNYDKIVLKAFDSDTAATQALLSGQISMWGTSPSETWTAMAEENDFSLYGGVVNLNGVWVFDQQGAATPALADVRVRQALNYAVDRDAIAEAIFGGDSVGRVQPAGSSWTGFDEELESTYDYDPEKARELLGQTAYADGFSLPVVYFASGEALGNMLEVLGSNLADVGVTLEIIPVTTVAELLGTWGSGTVSGAAVPVDTRSVYQYITSYHGAAGNNAMALGQTDEDLLSLVDEAAVVNTDEAWRGVLSWMTENAFTLPIVQSSQVFVATNDIDISDAHIDSSGTMDFARIMPAP